MACWNTAIRDSSHSSDPRNRGEFAASANWGPAMAWEAFHTGPKRSRVTSRCSCMEVQADSAAMSCA